MSKLILKAQWFFDAIYRGALKMLAAAAEKAFQRDKWRSN